MSDIKDRFLYFPYTMPKKIYGYHRYAIAVRVIILQDVVGVGVLRTEVLSETQCFRLKPSLLKLYQHKFKTAIILTDFGAEVDTEHRNLVTCAVGVFMFTHFYFYNLSLKKGGKHSLGHAVVLHEVFENRVINRICNTYHHSRIFFSLVQR